MLVLAPDELIGDRELRVAEQELTAAGLACVGMRIRLSYNAAPDRVREQEMAARGQTLQAAR